MLNEEIWKDVIGFEGKYEVSTLGQVRNSLGRVMKPYINNSGYACIKLTGGDKKHFLVHRLVAAAFVDNPAKHSVVNHLDSHRLNNAANNLEWCTTKENLQHARDLGRMPYNKPTLGKKLKGGRIGTSGFHGVFRRDYKYKGKVVEKWRCYLCVEGKVLESKTFPTELEAALHYDHLLAKYGITSKPKNFPKNFKMPNDHHESEYSQAAGNGSHPNQGVDMVCSHR